MNLQILEVIPSQPSPRDPSKRIPPKVKFNNGTEAAVGRDVDFNSLQVGAWGEAGIATKQNGQYTNHSLVTWNPTMPAGQTPAQFPNPPQPVQNAAKVDQAVWDAKDRAMAMMASNKPAAEIVCALIAHGSVSDLASAQAAYDALSKSGYEMVILARQNRVATSVDPFADE